MAGAPRNFFPGGHRRRKGSVVGGHHGECGARAYNGGLGQSPQRGPGSEPRVRGSGAKPPEAESILVIGCPTEPANLAPFQKCICISTVGTTVMIWENFMSKSRGVRWPPLPLPGGAHGDDNTLRRSTCHSESPQPPVKFQGAVPLFWKYLDFFITQCR